VIRRLAATSVLVAATVVVLGGGAAHAASGPTTTGHQHIAPYTYSYAGDVSSNGSKTLAVWVQTKGSLLEIRGRLLATDVASEGPAFTIDGGRGLEPHAAWNGSAWLVVWHLVDGNGFGPVVGQFVSGSGGLIGDRFTIGTGTDQYPSVAAGADGELFVTWTRNGAAGYALREDVYGARVAADGSLLDASPRRLSIDRKGFATSDLKSDVAWNGSSYLIVWMAERTAGHATLVASQRAADGSLLHAGALSATPTGSNFPAVASDGHDFLVVSCDLTPSETDVYGVRVTAAFATTRFLIADHQGNETAIAFNGSYLVTWTGAGDHLWGTRVETDLTVADPDGVQLTSGSDGWDHYDSVAPGGPKPGTFALLYSVERSDYVTGTEAVGLRWAPK